MGTRQSSYADTPTSSSKGFLRVEPTRAHLHDLHVGSFLHLALLFRRQFRSRLRSRLTGHSSEVEQLSRQSIQHCISHSMGGVY